MVAVGANGADRVSLRGIDDSEGGLNAEDHVAVPGGLAAKQGGEGLAVQVTWGRAAGQLDQGGEHVDEMDHRVAGGAALDPPGPADDERHPEASVVAGPLRERELGALVGGVDHQRIVLAPGFFQRIQGLPDFLVHVGHVGIVVGHGGPGLGQVEQVRGDGNPVGVVAGVLGPGQVRVVRGEHQAERGVGHVFEETADLRTLRVFEGELIPRADVRLPRQGNAVAKLRQVHGHRLDARVHLAMVRIGAVAHGVEAGVHHGATGRAHRGGGKRPGQSHALAGKPIDVRGPHDRVAVAAVIGPGLVVGDDNQKAGPLGGTSGTGQHRRPDADQGERRDNMDRQNRVTQSRPAHSDALLGG